MSRHTFIKQPKYDTNHRNRAIIAFMYSRFNMSPEHNNLSVRIARHCGAKKVIAVL